MNRKTRNIIIAAVVIAAIAAAAVIIGVIVSNRQNNRAEYVALGDEQISRGHYIYFCTQGYDKAYSKTGISDASLFDQKIDGEKAETWMENYAVGQAERYLTVNKMFDDLGLELSEEDEQAIDSRILDEWFYTGRIAVFGPMGVEEDVYRDIVTTDKKFEKLSAHFRSELEGRLTDKEIQDCFKDNYASAMYIAMHYIDENNVSTLEEYEKYCDQVKKGKPVVDLVRELHNSGIGYVVTSIDDKTGKNEVVFERNGSIFPLNFIRELFDSEVGDVIYYDDSPNMIYVIAQKTDLLADEDNLRERRDEVVDILLSDQMEDKIEGEMDTYKFSVNKTNTVGVNIRELYGM